MTSLVKRPAKAALPPLPQPGPVKASERLALKKARRLDLKPESHDRDRLKAVRRELQKRHGIEYFRELRERRRRRDSLREFTKACWHILEPGTKLEWNWHLDVLCDALEKVTRGEIRRLLINIPPGHMKSLLVSVIWPAWVWLEDPSWRAIFATYVQTLSNRDAIRQRDLVNNDWYRRQIPRVWGEGWDAAWDIKADLSGIMNFGTTLTGFRLSTSVGGAGAGFRGNGIVIDDPMNTAEFPTPDACHAVNAWFDVRMSSRLNDMETGFIVIIMQRLHENDLAGHVLKQDEENKDDPTWIPFEHVCLRSEYDPLRPNKYDRRTKKGELLFENKFSQPVINRAKVQLGQQYSAQHDQDPVPQSGGIFPMSKFCFWYPSTLLGNEIPPPHYEYDEDGNRVACTQGPLVKHFDTMAQSWDCAFKDKEDNDFVAGQTWGRLQARFFLVDRIKGHFGLSATEREIKAMTKRQPRAFAKYIEDKANGPAVIDRLKNEILGLIPIDPKGGKKARMEACEPLVKAGNVWLPHPALFKWVHEMLAELRAAPRGANDDEVDAMTQLLIEMALNGMATIQGMTKD